MPPAISGCPAEISGSHETSLKVCRMGVAFENGDFHLAFLPGNEYINIPHQGDSLAGSLSSVLGLCLFDTQGDSLCKT